MKYRSSLRRRSTHQVVNWTRQHTPEQHSYLRSEGGMRLMHVIALVWSYRCVQQARGKRNSKTAEDGDGSLPKAAGRGHRMSAMSGQPLTKNTHRASRSLSRRARMSFSRTGPFTLRIMERLGSSMNSTRTCVTPPREPVRPRTYFSGNV